MTFLPVFVIGSPRSGTSIIGDCVGLHPKAGNWFEPYFVLDRFFREAPTDVRTAADVSPEVRDYVSREFAYFARKRRAQVVIDKSPRNSFKIPFLHAIFPGARFVHVVRDGREATLSILREWEKRRAGYPVRKASLGTTLKQLVLMKRVLGFQLPRHRLQALHFEMGSWFNFDYRSFQHRLRWGGSSGFGPRFPGWEEVYGRGDLLELSARQWAESVRAVEAGRGVLGREDFLEVRYETFIEDPRGVVDAIHRFLGLERLEDFSPVERRLGVNLQDVRYLGDTDRRRYTGKWKKAFGPEQLQRIGPIIQGDLGRLGYAADESWFHDAQQPADAG